MVLLRIMLVSFVFQTLAADENFSINRNYEDISHFDVLPASNQYTAVYIVEGIGRGGSLNILCNHSQGEPDGWRAVTLNRQVPQTEQSILEDNPDAVTTFFTDPTGSTLVFNNPAQEMEGIYSCLFDTLRIQLTFSMFSHTCTYVHAVVIHLTHFHCNALQQGRVTSTLLNLQLASHISIHRPATNLSLATSNTVVFHKAWCPKCTTCCMCIRVYLVCGAWPIPFVENIGSIHLQCL